MNILKELENVNGEQEITVLVREPGIYEIYVDYFLGKDDKKLAELNQRKQEGDLLPVFTVKDFLKYYQGRQLLKEIHREGKILSFT